MRHVTSMSLTASLGLMAIFTVDFIDMIFIASLGNPALAAAIGYAGTVLFFTSSISIGLSIAAGVLVAKSIGAGEGDKAAGYATSVMMLGIAVCLLVVFAVGFNVDALLNLLGASEDIVPLAKSYLLIILPTMPVLMAAMICGAVLRAHGDVKRATMGTIAGGVVNAALDPLLIFGLGMGLQGAAVASVLARFTILIVSFVPVQKRYRGFVSPNNAAFFPSLKAIAGISLPAMAANVATPVGTGIVTREMAKFGTDAVAGMAIIGRLTPVAFAVVFALSGAIGAIVGQNFGAGQYKRVQEAFIASLKFVALYVLLVAVVLYLSRGMLADAFSANGVTLSLLYMFCGPLALAYIFNGWIFVGNATFNNLGHPLYSTLINWGKSTIGTWPLVIVGAALWGANGVLLGQALGSLIFAGLSVWVAVRMIDQLRHPKTSGYFDEHVRMHVVECRRH